MGWWHLRQEGALFFVGGSTGTLDGSVAVDC